MRGYLKIRMAGRRLIFQVAFGTADEGYLKM